MLLDHDKAGTEAADKAIAIGVIKEGDVKYTVCNGSPESEFEDCLKPEIYANQIKDSYNVDIHCKEFRGKAKWSDRMKQTFLSQGSRWSDAIEQKVKILVSDAIPDNLTKTKLNSVLISQKSGFLSGLALALENFLTEDGK